MVSSCTKLFFSDDFIKAQQQLARWASEDVVSVVVVESDSSAVDPSLVVTAQNIIHPQNTSLMAMNNGLGATVSREIYYPSPPSTTETESSGSVMALQLQQQQLLLQQQHLQQQQQRRGVIDVNGGPQENTGRYPEYKH